ncbi:MAG: hypothetical protein ACI8RD_011243 [Bacillariaceae sp.]|jgi:hypothetical protein
MRTIIKSECGPDFDAYVQNIDANCKYYELLNINQKRKEKKTNYFKFLLKFSSCSIYFPTAINK